MTDRIPVFVYAADPISQAGLVAQLRSRPEVTVVAEGDVDTAAVAVVLCEEVDDDALRVARALQRNGCPKLVLVARSLDDAALLRAAETGASSLLRRSEASPERLVTCGRSARAGDGAVPPDLLGRLLDQVGRLQRQVLAPRGLTMSGLAERELQVLRLVADGLDTAEIAGKLSYSERTVKNVIHDITSRFQLRNRAHAVAYAVREGLI